MVKNKGNKKDKPVAGNRDAVLKDSEDASVSTPATDFLEDMVMLHRIMWKIEGKKAKKEGDLTEVAERVLKIVQEGKPYELAGLKGVPAPFLKSTGRLLRKDGDDVKELTGKDATSALRKHIFQAFSKDDLEDMSNSPYKETKEMLNRKSDGDKITDPAPKDAILLECSDTSDGKPNDPQGGSKVIFTLASQLVSSFTKDSPSRVKAALAIMNGLYETQNPTVTDAEGKDKPGTPKFARFLVRTVGTGDSYTWKTIPLLEAAEFALTFAFEVFLEKELVLIDEASGSGDSKVATEGTSTEPIQQLDDYDVLFGRGGLTNAHAGNRRFRDIISLHRPDYIRAIKMDKPTVARKIVKAIRMGNPPGRYVNSRRLRGTLCMNCSLTLAHYSLRFIVSSRRAMMACGMTSVIARLQRRHPRVSENVPMQKSGSDRSFVVHCVSERKICRMTKTTNLPARRPRLLDPTASRVLRIFQL